ncbi:MAG TPA: MmgE/PrpD family protein [Burkholderiales bacterium]|jgi:2-methylcitrate dehydratase PrpD|nr:MmgE/PrpD family protein [Burkholderiales bacterium]
MAATIATQLANHFHKFDYRQLPDASRIAVKRLLLDYLGVAIAGSQTESGHAARMFAQCAGTKSESTLIGDSARVPAALAAFANAISSHSIELDDIDVIALFHFSPPVFSAALATAEQHRASGKQLLVALAAGCEMMERVSRAANNSLRNRGFHTTPTCGVFGATVAAAKLARLTPAKMTSAFGLAGAQASGLMEMYGPSMQKRFNPGPAARNGITAAGMAHFGFTGADTIFEGERGFLRTFTDKFDASQLTAGFDEPYQLDIEFKPYSCARPIHNAIDCALEIRRQHQPKLDEIKHIAMARHPDWAHYHQNKTPQTYHEAQVSLPYSVAVALKEGQALLKQYTDRKLKDPVLRRLSDVVDISVDASLPRGVSCKMTMTMTDGREFVSQIDYPKGSIQNSMSDAELRVKFDTLATPVIGATHAAQLADLVADVEQVSDIGKLMRLTAKPKRAVRK